MSWPDHLLTLEEFSELPEDNSRRYELQEGTLHVTPKAASLHQRVVKRLTRILDDQLSDEWEAVPDVEVVLAPQWPPTLRIPDVVVAGAAVIDENRSRLHAQDVLLAVEVVSPGSGRTDQILKRHEYAQAGIPFYWVVNLEPSPTLTAGSLRDGVYKTAVDVDGVFETVEPYELSVDLGALVRRSRRP